MGLPEALVALFGVAVVISLSSALDARSVVFVVIGQNDAYHSRRAEELKESLKEQASQLKQGSPVIHVSYESWSGVDGAWTVFPLLPTLARYHGSNCSWVMFLQDRTVVNLKVLLEELQQLPDTKELFVGRALSDKEATIIHHFAFFEDPSQFSYPNLASGFLLSSPLLKRLSRRLLEKNDAPDFSIDASHELALWIWNEGKAVALTSLPHLCSAEESGDECATRVQAPKYNCDEFSVSRSDILFAVKTCSKFHKERVPVVKNTWGKHAHKIYYYSDTKDKSVPTIATGIPNTERGHCSKTLAILKHAIKKHTEGKWIVIADDDTLLSVSRIQDLLSCFDSDQAVILGERYGYMVTSNRGYNYPTGGAGIVFSLAAARSVVDRCQCPSDESPDDMVLGMCLQSLSIPLLHIPEFHQARPDDYPDELLLQQQPVTFHKHWMVDPVSVYSEWFLGVDESVPHSEL